MSIAVGFIVGIAVFAGLGYLLFPLVYSGVHGLFESADLGTIAAIIALLFTIGFVFAISEIAGALVAIMLGRK